jgi:hypothetical protein
VRQVQFQVNLEPIGANSCACDTATPQQISASVHSFLYGTDTVPKQSTAAAARAVHHRSVAAKLPLVTISSAGLAQAQTEARHLPFALEYPRVQDAGGTGLPVDLRDYLIRAPNGTAYPAYVAVFSNGLLGQYYDVQGMTWTAAPMFANPDQTVTVAGRTYSLFYSGQHLAVVAWYAHGAVYWVHNSLTNAVANGELLAIAEQTAPIGTPGTPGSLIGGNSASGHTRLKAVVVPARTDAVTTTNLAETLGSIGGLLTLIAAPLLCLALLRRRRGLSQLRGQLHSNIRLTAQLSAATANAPGMSPSTSEASPAPYTRHESSSVRLRALAPRRIRTPAVATIAVTSIAVAGAVVLFDATTGSTPAKHAASSPTYALPTVPVAVLNATSTQGAAGRLAQQIRSREIRIAAVGNLAESRPPGLWILYAPGARIQAARLAHLLAAQAPRIAPIDPTAQAAAGTTAKVVAVIS